jgi:Tfp pilus assembly protein PilX
MSETLTCIRNQRGVAMVIAMISLGVLSLLVLALTLFVNAETRIASLQAREMQALNLAEAGVAEVLARLGTQQLMIDTVTTTPTLVNQVFCTSGALPALGADSVAVRTAQPAGAWLSYSTPDRSASALTVAYETDSARTTVYRYDKTKNPPINTTTGTPIYRITSTGTVGTVSKRLVVEATRRSAAGAPSTILAAEMANTALEASGGSGICGLNHSPLMPPGADHTLYHTGTGDVTGGWSTSSATTTGGGSFTGNPASQAYQTGFPVTPWAMLGMTQADFLAWVGPPHSTIPASPMAGPLYLDNDGIPGNNSASFSFNGGCQGIGFLYVDGSLTMLAGSSWIGVIYTQGNATNAASSFLLGSMLCNGTTLARTSGSGTVNYCSAAIKAITWPSPSGAGKMSVIAWKEVP